MASSSSVDAVRAGHRRSTAWYIAALNLVALPIVITTAIRAGQPSGLTWLLGAMVVLSRVLPIPYYTDDEIHGITFDEAVLLAILFVAAPGHAGLVFAVGATVAHLILRPDPLKVTFNAAQAGLAATLSAAVFVGITGGGSTDVFAPASLLAATLAVAVYDLSTDVMIAEVFRRLHGQPWMVTLTEVRRVTIVSSFTNLVLGLLFAALLIDEPRAFILGIGIMLAARFGLAGFGKAAIDSDRAEGIQATSRSLTGVAAGSFQDFLAQQAALFRAQVSEVVLVEPDGLRRLRWENSKVAEGSVDLDLDPILRTALATGKPSMSGGGAGRTAPSVMVAPVNRTGRTVGAVVVRNRQGIGFWESQDLALLGSLANDVAVALGSFELFRQVEHERERLAEESNKLSDMIAATSDGIVVVDRSGKIAVWNEAMAAIAGVSEQDAIGAPWQDILHLHEATNDRDLADVDTHALLDTWENEADFADLELKVRRPDGQWRWLRATLNPIRRAGGESSGIVMVARDATADMELERLKADFLATVSHELRTPLTPLQGFVETLGRFGDRLDDAKRGEIVGSMSRQVERLRHLVEDLMLVADRDAGRNQALQADDVDVSEIIEDVWWSLGDVDRDRVELQQPLGGSVRGDAVAIRRIVGQFIDNALKHTDDDVEVRVRGDGETLLVEVEDDGTGIPPHERERIFDRFGRLGDHLHRPQGPGLGLAIARELAQEMGGEIRVSDGTDGGAVFGLVLPRSK